MVITKNSNSRALLDCISDATLHCITQIFTPSLFNG